jgi:hypothetical protein
MATYYGQRATAGLIITIDATVNIDTIKTGDLGGMASTSEFTADVARSGSLFGSAARVEKVFRSGDASASLRYQANPEFPR